MTSRERANALVDGWLGWHYATYADVTVTRSEIGTLVDLLTAALAAPALGWTTERPNLTGYYWWRTKAGTASFIVFIYHDQSTKHWMVDWGENESLLDNETDGELAGPILPPPDTRENEA